MLTVLWNLSTFPFQVRFWSTTTPRSFSDVTLSKAWLFTVMLIFFTSSLWSFWYVVISIVLFFLIFSTILLRKHQCSTLTMFEASLCSNWSTVFLLASRVLSSAYMSRLQFSTSNSKSLMNIMNRRGPKMEHWGTPDVTLMGSDMVCWYCTSWLLSLRYDLNHWIALSLNLYMISFCSNMLWLTMSKALRRSSRTSPVRSPLSMLAAHFGTSWNQIELIVLVCPVSGKRKDCYVHVKYWWVYS